MVGGLGSREGDSTLRKTERDERQVRDFVERLNFSGSVPALIGTHGRWNSVECAVGAISKLALSQGLRSSREPT